MASVFFSYSHKDEALRDALEAQLSVLKRQGVIDTWHNRRIGAGQELAGEIDRALNEADIILLLVSTDFLNSDYCHDIEMRRAMQRHDAGEAIVIPVILRPSMWHDTLFGKLMATPSDGKPVTQYPDRDMALLEVANAIKAAVQRLGTQTPRDRIDNVPAPDGRGRVATQQGIEQVIARMIGQTHERSSNLALAKSFTERDRDAFELETFDYLARFFENSAAELQARNPGIEASVRRIDANRFSATIYKHGTSIARCSIFIGERPYGSGIAYSQAESGTGFNELLTVKADDQSLFLTSMGMATMGGQAARDAKLTQEGAAELYWGMLIRPLQPRG